MKTATTLKNIIKLFEYILIITYPILNIIFSKRKDDDGSFFSVLFGILTIASIYHLCKKYFKKKYIDDVKYHHKNLFEIYGTFISGVYFLLIYFLRIIFQL